MWISISSQTTARVYTTRIGIPRSPFQSKRRRFMFKTKRSVCLVPAAFYLLTISGIQAQIPPPGLLRKLGVDVDMRSLSRVLADEARAGNNIILSDQDQHKPGSEEQGDVEFRGGNVQVNDPKLDYIQTFLGFRPFVRFTQSETSIASHNNNIVATYNNSAGIHLIPNPNGPGFSAVQISAQSGLDRL